jgi:hypothetical protein
VLEWLLLSATIALWVVPVLWDAFAAVYRLAIRLLAGFYAGRASSRGRSVDSLTP